MQSAQIPAPSLPARPLAGAGTEAVLVVEDDPGVRSLVSRMLGRVGYRVLCAADVDTALALVASSNEAIDLVLCDVIMPGHRGRDVVARIQAESGCPRALFMSGHLSASLIENGTLPKGSAFILKPFTPSELPLKVREVLDA